MIVIFVAYLDIVRRTFECRRFNFGGKSGSFIFVNGIYCPFPSRIPSPDLQAIKTNFPFGIYPINVNNINSYRIITGRAGIVMRNGISSNGKNK